MGERERRRKEGRGGGGRRKSLVGCSSRPARVPPPGELPALRAGRGGRWAVG